MVAAVDEKQLDAFQDPLYHGEKREQDKKNQYLDVLIDYVNRPDAHKDVLYSQDNACIIIRDKYAKACTDCWPEYTGAQQARFHYLVIPRRPLDYPSVLNQADLPLLRHLIARAQWLVLKLQKVPHAAGLAFRIGFHARPSIRQLHVHVISQDFESAALKNKKHWNSFTTPFFVDATAVLAQIEQHGRITTDLRRLEKHLNDPLRCHVCKKEQRNMPMLKEHIRTCKR